LQEKRRNCICMYLFIQSTNKFVKNTEQVSVKLCISWQELKTLLELQRSLPLLTVTQLGNSPLRNIYIIHIIAKCDYVVLYFKVFILFERSINVSVQVSTQGQMIASNYLKIVIIIQSITHESSFSCLLHGGPIIFRGVF